MFSGAFTTEDVDGLEDKGSGDTITVDVHTLLQNFRTYPWNLPVSLMKCFLVKSKMSSLSLYLSARSSDFWIIRRHMNRILLQMACHGTKKVCSQCWGFVYKTQYNIYVTLYIITHILVHIYNKDMVTTRLTIQNCK
jgi:hypothetical protein